MPSILGGNLRDKTDKSRVSDLGQRAMVLANTLQIPVMALQRVDVDDLKTRRHFLGLPKAYDPSEYAQVVTREAETIAAVAAYHGKEKISLVGVSAGAERGLAHVQSGLPYKSLFLFDPPAMHIATARYNFSRWAYSQARVAFQDITGRPDMPNENPLPYKAQGEVSGLQDMALHKEIWSGGQSFDTLAELANLGIASMTCSSTRLVIPIQSFNLPTNQVAEVVGLLNLTASDTKSDFLAEVIHKPHRVCDDPVRLAQMVSRATIFPTI